MSEVYTESPILFLFHPEDAPSEATAAGKLPLTLYESVFESSSGGPNDKAMDIDGAAQAKTLKFRELVYSIETGEAEMISVDFVARGGGNATAVEGNAASQKEAKVEEDKNKKGKGKQKEKSKEEVIDETSILTAEDEERKECPQLTLLDDTLMAGSSFNPHSENECNPHAKSTNLPPSSLSCITSTILSLRPLPTPESPTRFRTPTSSQSLNSS